ncbi:MAG: hypothetical protein TR69_WS6001000550 [candidate division WS6 bacterium OLB20]|uniref:Alpha/beta hydrolase n=1 Tax=candidate division WS6 bacterium OLB20 TaxID=1617426 RepID=A0A136LY22_9BACT|nr:MAG: hypothetical protein TR69_WS6001000550 [candidate division WS6 bacterium OLB20]
MQTQFAIPIADGKKIYGLLDRADNSDKAIVFVHGFTGSLNEHQYRDAVPYFYRTWHLGSQV